MVTMTNMTASEQRAFYYYIIHTSNAESCVNKPYMFQVFCKKYRPRSEACCRVLH